MARAVSFGESKKSSPNPWAGFEKAERAAKKAIAKSKSSKGGKRSGKAGGGS